MRDITMFLTVTPVTAVNHFGTGNVQRAESVKLASPKVTEINGHIRQTHFSHSAWKSLTKLPFILRTIVPCKQTFAVHQTVFYFTGIFVAVSEFQFLSTNQG